MASLILADWLVNAAATTVGDPGRQSIKTPDWLTFYNLAMNDICSIYDLVQMEATADLPKDGLASYPLESTRISEIQASDTPSDSTSFRVLAEKFEDEYRELTRTGIPTVSKPEWYFADKGYIRLGGLLAADVVDGLILKYYGVPDEAFDLAVTFAPIPMFMRSYAVERLVIYGYRGTSRDEQANAHETMWNAREDEIRDKLEDRSLDRRDSVRPEGAARKYRGMA